MVRTPSIQNRTTTNATRWRALGKASLRNETIQVSGEDHIGCGKTTGKSIPCFQTSKIICRNWQTWLFMLHKGNFRLWPPERVGPSGGLMKNLEKYPCESWERKATVHIDLYSQSRTQPVAWRKTCKSAACGALMMMASTWDLFPLRWQIPPHTEPSQKLCSSHSRNPTTDIYWSGALAV